MANPIPDDVVVNRALASADILWAIKKARVVVVGPWEPASRTGMSIGRGWWRCTPSGKDLVTVYPSMKLEKPETYEYATNSTEDSYEYDDERYEEDMTSYKAEKLIWKEWTVHLGAGVTLYADTLEEGKKIADEKLVERGILLYNGTKVEGTPTKMSLLRDEP